MGADGTFNTPVDPSGSEWKTVTSSSGAMTAYNQQINQRSWNSQEDRVIIADKDTLDTRFNQETKKFANQAALAEELNERNNVNVATDAQREFSPQYASYLESRGKRFSNNFYTYPLDIDPLQDHMKISKYKFLIVALTIVFLVNMLTYLKDSSNANASKTSLPLNQLQSFSEVYLKIKQNLVKNKTTSTSNPMFFALSSSQLGVSSLTINLILITSVTVLLALPTLFLLRSGKGKSAF